MQREVHEESGVRPPYLQVIPLYVYTDRDFRYYNFLAVVNDEFQPRLNWETQDSVWVRFGDWPNPLHFGLESLLQDRSSIETIRRVSEIFTQSD